MGLHVQSTVHGKLSCNVEKLGWSLGIGQDYLDNTSHSGGKSSVFEEQAGVDRALSIKRH